MLTNHPISQKHTIEIFLGLESQVWDAFVKGDAVADAKLLSDDFIGVYPSGISGKTKHCQSLLYGPIANSFQIIDPQIMSVSNEAALIIYLADWVRIDHDKSLVSERMYVSSLWRRYSREWKNCFSQDTLATG